VHLACIPSWATGLWSAFANQGAALLRPHPAGADNRTKCPGRTISIGLNRYIEITAYPCRLKSPAWGLRPAVGLRRLLFPRRRRHP